MKLLLLLSFIALMSVGLAAETTSPAKDSLAISPHSAVRARTSAGASIPDQIALNLEVHYLLASDPAGVVSLALDEDNDLQFSTFDSEKVGVGQGSVNLKAAVRMIQRPVLHCLVILKKKGAKPSDAPLASTGLTIDVKGLIRR